MSEPRDPFERALALYRRGDDRAAHAAARAVLQVAPDHVGGLMLALAAAGGCGDEEGIELALQAVVGQLDRLLEHSDVVAILDSDLMAPVARSRTFRQSVAPALGRVRRHATDACENEAARQVLEAVRDSSVERALFSAPVLRPALGPAPLRLLDRATGRVVAVLRPGTLYVGGRGSVADIRLDHPSVSRMHFNVQTMESSWVVQNASRTNGTELNGRRIGEAWTLLQDGDTLRVGQLTLEAAAASPDELEPPALVPVTLPRPDAATSRFRRSAQGGAEPTSSGDLLKTAPNPVLPTRARM